MRRFRTISTLTVTAILFCAVASIGQAAQIRKPTTAIEPAGCVTADCHASVKQHQVVHGPVSVNACDACHALTDVKQHTFEMARPEKDLCLFCHEIDTVNALVVHKPLETGQCLQCHNAHGGSNPRMLQADKASDLCKQCHEDVIGAKKSVHGPVAAGACAACHSPHVSMYPNLLLNRGTALCLECHVSTQRQLEAMRVVHGPAAVDCQACHVAHASDHAMILRKEPKQLCLECHETIQHTLDTAKTQHQAVTTDRACLNCHSPHASDYPSVLRGSMLDLCLECHDRPLTLPDGRKLADIKAVLDTGASLHGPVAQANCAACHLIHGGDNFRLLIKEYPPQFYAPFAEQSYALCFSCHDPQLVRDEKTTSLTNFRNGDVNMHHLHVNREKGRTCRACHETHASRHEKHIRDAVPFGSGGWMLPIAFEKTQTGGSCTPGCHRPFAYDRVSPIDNSLSTTDQGVSP